MKHRKVAAEIAKQLSGITGKTTNYWTTVQTDGGSLVVTESAFQENASNNGIINLKRVVGIDVSKINLDQIIANI